MKEIIEQLRSRAESLISKGEAKVVLGYRIRNKRVSPYFAYKPEDVRDLTFSQECTHNLARYLVGRDGLTKQIDGKIAIVAIPSVLKTIVGLMQEAQIQREKLVILAITDGSKVGLIPDAVVGKIEPAPDVVNIEQIEKISLEDRRKFWNDAFSRCIRCYACRAICPFCYCLECIAEKNLPQWINKSPVLSNNWLWLLTRAMHLAGRCVLCGECQRACPAQIPLLLLHKKIAIEIKQNFDYEPGQDTEAKPPLADFRMEDKAEFIL